MTSLLVSLRCWTEEPTDAIGGRVHVRVAEPTLWQADYELEEEREALRDAFATFFERECPPERVREAEPDGFDEKLWRQLVEMRVVAMGVPEAAGGDGAGLVELALVAEQHGRRLAPVPLIEAVVTARLLARCSGDAARGWVRALNDGVRFASLALQPARDGDRQLVPFGALADAVVALVGDDLVLCTGESTPVANQGRTPLAWWQLPGGSSGSTVLLSGPEAVAAYERARRDWRLLTAAALVGIGDGALAIAVEHARERIAFGVPIGSFQAVAHPLVDVAMAVETARRIVWKAAWWADTDEAAQLHLVPMAHLAASEAADLGARVGVHTLGGVGFTVESDEQLYFRRAKGWTLVGGDPQAELDRIADALYGPTEPVPAG